MDPLVLLQNVTKIYEGATQAALDDVSLRIPAGEVTAIMGPSGSGKSTLLNMIGGLDRPTDGMVRVNGVEITRLGEAALARYRRATVGLIFQFFNLLENLTAFENVALAGRLAGLSRPEVHRRTDELLEQLGIGEVAQSYPARLSGGQRQRIAIARALINRPALLLADEPTGALDSRTGESVIDLLKELNRGGQTIVLVTHDPRLAERCSQRIVTLVDGRPAQDRVLLEAVR
jgi:putative ABC transport system ATP-binding protein